MKLNKLIKVLELIKNENDIQLLKYGKAKALQFNDTYHKNIVKLIDKRLTEIKEV